MYLYLHHSQEELYLWVSLNKIYRHYYYTATKLQCFKWKNYFVECIFVYIFPKDVYAKCRTLSHCLSHNEMLSCIVVDDRRGVQICLYTQKAEKRR